jgi:hypothetical protein
VSARVWSELFNLLTSKFNLKAVFLHQVDGCNQNFGWIRNQSLTDALRLVVWLLHGWIRMLKLWGSLNRLLGRLCEIQVQQTFNLRLVVFDQVHTSVPLL